MTDDSATETSVLMLASGGMPPVDIAEALAISEHEVRQILRQTLDDEPPPLRAA